MGNVGLNSQNGLVEIGLKLRKKREKIEKYIFAPETTFGLISILENKRTRKIF